MSDSGHGSHHVNYLLIFVLLCGFTALSVVADLVEMPSKAVLIVIVFAIASAKATCVLLFFMHLKFEGNWKLIILAPTTILAIGLPIALMPDVAFHYYINDAAQIVHDDIDTDGHDESHPKKHTH